MASRGDSGQPRRPSGGRPLPRRLFSSDSGSSSGRESTELLRSEPLRGKTRAQAQGLSLGSLEEESSGRIFPSKSGVSEPWIDADKALHESPHGTPHLETSASPTFDGFGGPVSPPIKPRYSVASSVASESSRDGDTVPIRTRSRVRWEQLRTHVLPSKTSGVATPPLSSPVLQPLRPHSPGGVRPQGPKPSRFQRLGLRGVVEQVREVRVDESRRFAEEIQRACLAARVADPIVKGGRTDREFPTVTTGSNFTLPFSHPSAASSTATLVAPQTQFKKGDILRPPSIASSFSLGGRPSPSLRYLRQAILHYAPPSESLTHFGGILPHETLVLSTLLLPVFSEEPGPLRDEERWFALESFEVIVQTWPASSYEMFVERCLWCCRAASCLKSSHRSRTLGTLSALLSTPEQMYQKGSPEAIRTLLQGLFTLLPVLFSDAESESSEYSLVSELITKITRDAACQELDRQAFEKHVDAPFSSHDEDSKVLQVFVSEALVGCLEKGCEMSRKWILRNALLAYWPSLMQPSDYTEVVSSICYRRQRAFSRSALSCISVRPVSLIDLGIIVQVLRTRVIPESKMLRLTGKQSSREDIIRLLLELLCLENAGKATQWATDAFCEWYNGEAEWKTILGNGLKKIIADSDWPLILKILPGLVKTLPEGVRKHVSILTIPLLFERLADEPPAHPCLPLTTLLNTLSSQYPQVFYKPLFACAASSKDALVVNHLWIITAISYFLPDFWLRDVDMTCVAVMSDPKEIAESAGEPAWGKVKLGQSVLLVELICQVQKLRAMSDSSNIQTDHSGLTFFGLLESRLSILIEAKEQRILIPLAHRVLLSALLTEIRLFTRTLKSSGWLSRVVLWLVTSPSELPSDNDDFSRALDDEVQRFRQDMDKVRAVYLAAKEGPRASTKQRNTILFSPNSDSPFSASPLQEVPHHLAVLSERPDFIRSLSKGLTANALPLLVSVSVSIPVGDYEKLCPFIWRKCLNSNDAQTIMSACFMAMQCAEKTGVVFMRYIMDDLNSLDAEIRRCAIEKIARLVNWRFQLLSQPFFLDRSYRRPFKLTRGPLPFVATDIGSSQFVPEEDPNDLVDNLPLELRRRLSEMGWSQDDQPSDKKYEWARTPISLLAASQLERFEKTAEPIVSPSASPNLSPSPSIRRSPSAENNENSLRRKPSTGATHGVKRRAVFVPTMTSALFRVIFLVFDKNSAVASTARSIMTDLMRNDTSLITRPILDSLCEGGSSLQEAISALRALLHVHRTLPPAMAHYIFNHLSGYLKYIARQEQPRDPLDNFAHTVPIIAKLLPQVSEMSMREMRRAKVEMFFIPSGLLWFTSAAPLGPMFPRRSTSRNPFEVVSPDLVSITVIRVSQNMLLLSMLSRNPQDVQSIRKSISRLVLPSLENVTDAHPLEMADFVPHSKPIFESSSSHNVLKGLSLMLSRSYILLIAQIFRSMSRHLNDRNELAIFIDGLNRVLLAHGNDIGIVGQALICLMVASTRFRRLFISGGAYSLFMPALLKVYAEAEEDSGIRLAIEYAIHRFYALHQESFLFQSLDVISHLTFAPGVKNDWFAGSVFALFSSLSRGVSPSDPDPAGIHNANKSQEREALLVNTAEDKPQTFLASLRFGGSGKDRIIADFPEEYESPRLRIDNLLRLFVTVIAHDPTIARAEHFLRLFRYLVPYLYEDQTSSSSLLREGVGALGVVLTRAFSKTKQSEPTVESEISADVFNHEATLENHLLNKSKSPCDVVAMRLDYLSLVVEFTRVGGRLSVSAHQRTIDLAKTMLRDNLNRTIIAAITSFFTDYTRASLLQDPAPGLKDVLAFLRELSPVVNAYAGSLDFTGIFDALSELASNPIYSNDVGFSNMVVTGFCTAGLESCEMTAAQNLLLDFPMRQSLVRLLNKAVALRDADIFAEIEKRAPSYDFLVSVVLPLAATLETTAELVAVQRWAEGWRRDAHARAWVRLLFYTMSAGARQERTGDSSDSSERTRSRDKRQSTISGKLRMKTLVVAIQILKIIVVRAEEDLSTCLPGIWHRIASFLKTLLADGNASFAFGQGDISAPASPLHSPRGSISSPKSPVIGSNPFDIRASPFNYGQPTLLNPRVIDYSMWSLMELLLLHRSPLMLQMRLFVKEKLVSLDQELRTQQKFIVPTSSRSRRVSSSSVFAKPRQRLSSYQSSPSRDNSPMLSASQSFPSAVYLQSPEVRQPGYARSPISPSDGNRTGPRIVHLGPTSSVDLNFRMSLASGKAGASVPSMTRSAVIRSLKLIQETYKRIRLIQTCMGYDLLLPLPRSDIEGSALSVDDDDDLGVATRTWSRKQALEAILKETIDLAEEFEETVKDVDKDMVVVDADQSVTF